MARVCAICGKRPRIAVKRKLLRGHYNPTWKGYKYPNLQWAKLPSGKRVKACTQCIKSMHKVSKT